MDLHIPFGSHLHIIQPISLLLKESKTIYDKYADSQDPIIQKCLQLIPAIDLNKIDSVLADAKASNLKSILQQNGYRYPFDDLDFNKIYTALSKYSDFQTIIIFLFCIFANIYSNGIDFIKILSLLQKTQRSPLIQVHEFCFELVLSSIISSPQQKGVYEIVLNYILNINSLPPTSFPLLMTLFNLVSKNNNQTEMVLLKHTLAHMLDCDFACCSNVDPAIIIDSLIGDIMEFDKSSLLVLGTATNKSKASAKTMKIIHNLYNKFITFIIDNCPKDQNLDLSTESPFRIDQPLKITKQEFAIKQTKSFEFQPLPFDKLLKDPTINFLPQNVNDLVISMGNFLMHASTEVVFDFLAQFSIYLHKKEHFLEFCSIIIIIAIHLTKLKTTPTVIELLSQTILFSPHQTVFNENEFDHRINYLRSQVFDLIALTDSTQVITLLKCSAKDPYLLNEHFLRILLLFEKFPPTIFCDETAASIILNSILQLQTSDPKNIEIVKSANFEFIQKIILQPEVIDYYFSLNSFTTILLQMLFEPGLQKFVLWFLLRAFQLMNDDHDAKFFNNTLLFYRRLVQLCCKRFKESEYAALYLKSIEIINLGLRYHLSYVPYFSYLYNDIFELMRLNPTHETILCYFSFLQLTSFTSNIILTSRQYSVLYTSIKNIQKDNEPNQQIVDNIIMLLKNSYFVNVTNNSYIIENPSFLPLLFAIHGKSKSLIKLLMEFKELCIFSMFNSNQLHEGYIDYLLIEYLSKQEDNCQIKFRDTIIDIYIDREKNFQLILDILGEVLKRAPTFSITYKLLNLLSITNNDRIWSFLSNLLLGGMSEINRIVNIPFDSPEPLIQFNGIEWTPMKTGFTMDFFLLHDRIVASKYQSNFVIFEIMDDSYKFSIELKNSSIIAKYETPTTINTLYLIKNFLSFKWNHFVLIGTPNNDKMKFINVIDQCKQSDQSMDPIIFSKSCLTARIGGSDFDLENYKRHPFYSIMAGFSFFPFCLSDDNINHLFESRETLPDQPLITTSQIHSEMVKTIKLTETLSINLLPSYHRMMHILDYICDPILFDKIISLPNFQKSLDFLLYAFHKHPSIQQFFNCIGKLVENTMKNPTYSIYLSLYYFVNFIRNKELLSLWFEKLILNLKVWCKSSEIDLIMLHWTTTFKSHSVIYSNKNYFVSLLTQFMTFYVYSNDKQKLSTKTIQVFFSFLKKFEYCHFNLASFESLLFHIGICKNPLFLSPLVKILLDVSKFHLVLDNMTEERLSRLHQVFSIQNLSIMVDLTCCIDNLRLKLPQYSLVSVSYFLFDYKDLSSFCDSLLRKLNNHPKLLSLLTVLCISTGKSTQLVKKIEENMKSDRPTLFSIIDEDLWYIWPIMLMLNVSDDDCNIVCKLIAICVSSTLGSDQIDQVFAMMFRMSFFIPKYDMIGHVLHDLYMIYNEANATMPDLVIEYCYIFFFLHIPQELHSLPLLNLFDNGVFPLSNRKRSSMTLSKFDLFDLENLFNGAYLNFSPQCRILLNDKGTVQDVLYYKIFRGLKVPKKQGLDIKLMEYFLIRDKLDQTQRFSMAQNLTNLLDSLKSHVMNDLVKLLAMIQNKTLALLLKSKEIVNYSPVVHNRLKRSSTMIKHNISIDNLLDHQEKIQQQSKSPKNKERLVRFSTDEIPKELGKMSQSNRLKRSRKGTVNNFNNDSKSVRSSPLTPTPSIETSNKPSQISKSNESSNKQIIEFPISKSNELSTKQISKNTKSPISKSNEMPRKTSVKNAMINQNYDMLNKNDSSVHNNSNENKLQQTRKNEFINNNEPSTDSQSKNTSLKIMNRSNILSPSFYPFRYKNNENSPNSRIFAAKRFFKTTTLYEDKLGSSNRSYTCILLKAGQEKRQKYKLNIYNDKFILEKNKRIKIIPFDLIVYFVQRKIGSNVGYEIYLSTKKSYLLLFQPNEIQEITSNIKPLQLNNTLNVILMNDVTVPDLSAMTNDWINGNLSNFEYLLKLNLLSGRSFKSLLLYPVMPPIVSDLNDLTSNPDPQSFIKNSPQPIPILPVNDLNQSFVKRLFVASDFYFNPQIADSIDLPVWAQNKFDFIYKSRKKLEISDVSWFIDFAFGELSDQYKTYSVVNSTLVQSNYKENRQLFTSKHPKRNEQYVKTKPTVFQTGRKFGYVRLYLANPNNLISFNIVSSNPGMVYDAELNDEMSKLKYNSSFRFQESEDDDLIYFDAPPNIYAYSPLKCCIYYFKSSSLVYVIPIYTKHFLFTGVNNIIFFCRDESILCSINIDDLVRFSSVPTNSLTNVSNPSSSSQSLTPSSSPVKESQLAQFGNELESKDSPRNAMNPVNYVHVNSIRYDKFIYAETRITSLSASSNFTTIVYATIDGFIHIHDSTSSKEVAVYYVGCEITDLKISRNWGFISALSENMIYILSINGELITNYKFPFLIKKIFHFSIGGGFDYLMFQGNENQVGYFEVIYPNKWVPLKKFENPLISMSYDHLHRLFVIFEENGIIHFIPKTIPISI